MNISYITKGLGITILIIFLLQGISNSQTVGLHVEGQDVVFGDSFDGIGTKFIWDASKRAMRFGQLTSVAPTAWNASNIGLSSLAFGRDNKASGEGSLAYGGFTQATHYYASAWGDHAIASGRAATAWGYYTVAQSYAETVFGRYNTNVPIPVNSENTWVNTDRLFVIGNGTSNSNRSDALVMYKNGDTRLHGPFQSIADNGKTALIGLKENTGGTYFGYDLEYSGASDKLFLKSKGFSGNQATRMTWTKDGKVGIGTTSPQERLHVTGTIRSSALDDNAVRSIIADGNGNIELDERIHYTTVGFTDFEVLGEFGDELDLSFIGASADNANGIIQATLNIPDHVTLKEAVVIYRDNSSSNIKVIISGKPNLNEYGDPFLLSDYVFSKAFTSTGSSSSLRSGVIDLDEVVRKIDNKDIYYTITASNTGISGIEIKAIKVGYIYKD